MNVTVVGSNTSGTAIIGENGFVTLPGSFMRLKWGQWLSAELTDRQNGFREGTGFMPDYWIDPASWTPAEIVDSLRNN